MEETLKSLVRRLYALYVTVGVNVHIGITKGGLRFYVSRSSLI